MKSAKSLLENWRKNNESREAMKRAVVQHLTADVKTRHVSEFSNWFQSLANAKHAFAQLNKNFPKSALVDIFAKAFDEYLNFNPKRYVETDGEAERFRAECRVVRAYIVDRDIRHPNPMKDQNGREYLEHMCNRPRDPERKKSNRGNVPRQQFIRSVGRGMLKYLDLTGRVDPNVICDLVAIVDEAILSSQVRKTLATIAQEKTMRRSPEIPEHSPSVTIRIVSISKRVHCRPNKPDLNFISKYSFADSIVDTTRFDEIFQAALNQMRDLGSTISKH
jgi:hypothetical protein